MNQVVRITFQDYTVTIIYRTRGVEVEIIYNLSAFIIALGTPALLITLIVLLLKPHILNTRIKKTLSRTAILGIGAAVITTTFIGLGSVMAATEPESVKQARITRQLAGEKAEKEAEAAKAKLLAEQEKARAAEVSKPKIKTVTKTEVVGYDSLRQDDNSIPQGEEKVSIEGVNGERTITYEVTYVKEKEIDRKVIKNEITMPAVNKVTLVGTYIKPVTRSFSTAPAPQPQASSAYYANCSAARAAGAAPVYAGQPGYGSHLDRDNDGVGCE